MLDLPERAHVKVIQVRKFDKIQQRMDLNLKITNIGGPLVYNGVHVGIVSHAVGCAFSGYPTVYSRTSELRAFIDIYV